MDEVPDRKATGTMELDLDRFARIVVTPARAKWGVGWELLSDEQKLTEVRAGVLLNISAQETVEGDRFKDAAQLGLYARYMLACLDEWCQP